MRRSRIARASASTSAGGQPDGHQPGQLGATGGLSEDEVRSLLAGRDTKDPFKGVVTSSTAAHAIRIAKREIDVGKPEFGVSLPTCRHSQALDCAEDSEAWAAKASGGAGKSGGKRKSK